MVMALLSIFNGRYTVTVESSGKMWAVIRCYHDDTKVLLGNFTTRVEALARANQEADRPEQTQPVENVYILSSIPNSKYAVLFSGLGFYSADTPDTFIEAVACARRCGLDAVILQAEVPVASWTAPGCLKVYPA